MISIKNNQKKYPIDILRVERLLECLCTYTGYKAFDISVWCTTDQTIRRYNRVYRHIDKVTDILSFPFHHGVSAGSHIVAQSVDEEVLGDLIIAVPYVHRFCKREQCNFDVWMDRLLVHGFCHLIGYDHSTKLDHELMVLKEKELLIACGSFEAEKITF
jgi:rRNA maturation RNase YbeY